MRPDEAIPPLYGNYVPSSFRGAMTETVATLREVVLMARDITPVVPAQVAPHTDVVVLVHGFFASAGVFRPMRRHLVTDTGATVASFTHAPGAGIERIARSLARIVDRIPRDCRVHLVGHSLGGLVARWYVQELGGHARVTQTISLGSPFGGSPVAKRFPFMVGLDLHPTSPILERLRARASEHEVPHVSVAGADDRLVSVGAALAFPYGDHLSFERRGHNSLLYDPEVAALVVRRIRERRNT